jgi:hypothetical protein
MIRRYATPLAFKQALESPRASGRPGAAEGLGREPTLGLSKRLALTISTLNLQPSPCGNRARGR